jgi:5-methylcytosine-specific restriction protein A
MYQPRLLAKPKRPSPTARGYNYRWRRARLDYLRRNPLCVECLKHGYVAAATIVDHIVPHRGDEVLFWDEENWAAMCAGCHSRKTAKREGGFGNRREPLRG